MEYLDATLTRLGQVDLKIKLELTSRDINAQLFASIFKSNISRKREKAEDAKGEEETKVKELAAEFASKVLDNEFSLADI
jgi:hypothetical protein